jgi:hypothetical protein
MQHLHAAATAQTAWNGGNSGWSTRTAGKARMSSTRLFYTAKPKDKPELHTKPLLAAVFTARPPR